jgi:hypothetical protein
MLRFRCSAQTSAAAPDAAAKYDSPLLKAVFSPFRHNDLIVNLASGYVDDPQGDICFELGSILMPSPWA